MTKAAKEATKTRQVEKAKKTFYMGLFDLSWRLAAVFLAPLFAGLWLDRGKDSPTFAIVGLALGIVGSIYIIKQTVAEYTKKVELDD